MSWPLKSKRRERNIMIGRISVIKKIKVSVNEFIFEKKDK